MLPLDSSLLFPIGKTRAYSSWGTVQLGYSSLYDFVCECDGDFSLIDQGLRSLSGSRRHRSKPSFLS